jgi:1-deoxy-D-xylulose-5-phosphate reductoisomerase
MNAYVDKMNMKRRRIGIFGSTGSIGRSTLDVVKQHTECFEVRYLSAKSNADLLCRQVEEWRPEAVAVVHPGACAEVRERVGHLTHVLHGMEGLMELAGRDDYEIMVSALVGSAGLLPTVEAIRPGRQIALANKETLVAAGSVITGLVASEGATLVPIDSEHSAILQCLAGEDSASVKRLIITASGGPFRGFKHEDLDKVSVADALRHPNWSMGDKITIDSATLMNKGLEVIEAHWLFGLPAESIDVVVHPQSRIHSMVEFADGSIKAQLGMPDMKVPILYALAWPERLPLESPRIDWTSAQSLTFEAPDTVTFPCLPLAYAALETGGTAPACMNAANETAVRAFLDGALSFNDIPSVIESCLERIDHVEADSISTILDVDTRTRAEAARLLHNVPGMRRSGTTYIHQQ